MAAPGLTAWRSPHMAAPRPGGNVTQQVKGGGAVKRSAYFDVETYPEWVVQNQSVYANETLSRRCPPCYESPACPADESCYEFGNPGFGYHGFDNIVRRHVLCCAVLCCAVAA